MNKKFEKMVSKEELLSAQEYTRLYDATLNKLIYNRGEIYITKDNNINEDIYIINHERQTKDISKLKVLYCINNKLVEIDFFIYILIKALNEHGINTLYSCSGHEKDAFEGFYIRFNKLSMSQSNIDLIKKICDKLGLVFEHMLVINTNENDVYKESTISILNPTDEDIKQAKSLVLKDPTGSSFNSDFYDIYYNEFIDVRLYGNNERTTEQIDYDYIVKNRSVAIAMICKFTDMLESEFDKIKMPSKLEF